MPIKLPQEHQTSKYTSLPGDLKKIADDLISKKFGIKPQAKFTIKVPEFPPMPDYMVEYYNKITESMMRQVYVVNTENAEFWGEAAKEPGAVHHVPFGGIKPYPVESAWIDPQKYYRSPRLPRGFVERAMQCRTDPIQRIVEYRADIRCMDKLGRTKVITASLAFGISDHSVHKHHVIDRLHEILQRRMDLDRLVLS